MKFIHLEHDSVNFNNNTPVFYQQRRITRDTPCFTPASLSDILYNFYRPPTKLGEGIIFTGICHSVQGGARGTRSFLGWWQCLVPGPFLGVGMPGLVPGPFLGVGWVCQVHPRYTPLPLEGTPHLEGTPLSADI